jgi:ribosomal protein L22
METYSIHKGAQIAPLKARMTLDLIRGKNVLKLKQSYLQQIQKQVD